MRPACESSLLFETFNPRGFSRGQRAQISGEVTVAIGIGILAILADVRLESDDDAGPRERLASVASCGTVDSAV